MRLYGTIGWQKKRANQLRECPLCCYCERQGRVTAATVADHIIPHNNDAEAFWTNKLQSLCKPCHDSIKQRQELGQDVTVTGEDGWPLVKYDAYE